MVKYYNKNEESKITKIIVIYKIKYKSTCAIRYLIKNQEIYREKPNQ